MGLGNDDDINIPFAGLSSTERQPLTSFSKIWSMFPNEQIKFTHNVIKFNKLLKQGYLRKLSSTPRCTRLLCPHLMPAINVLENDSNYSNWTMYLSHFINVIKSYISIKIQHLCCPVWCGVLRLVDAHVPFPHFVLHLVVTCQSA